MSNKNNDKEFEDMLRMFDDNWDEEKKDIDKSKKSKRIEQVQLPPLEGELEHSPLSPPDVQDDSDFKEIYEDDPISEIEDVDEVEADKTAESQQERSPESRNKIIEEPKVDQEDAQETERAKEDPRSQKDRGENNQSYREEVVEVNSEENINYPQENNVSHGEEIIEDDNESFEEFGGGLLAGMPEEEDFEELKDNSEKEEDQLARKEEGEGDKSTSAGSEADEKAKAFFSNIKNKLFSKKGKKNSKKKSEKREKQPKKAKKKREFKLPEGNPLDKLTKKQKIIGGSVIGLLLIIILTVVFANFSYKNLDDLSHEVKHEDKETEEVISFEVSKLKAKEKELDIEIKNTGDLASNVSFILSLHEKTSIPFKSKEILCESDIINLEGAKETLSCNEKVDPSKKYKIKNTEVENF